MDTNTSKANLQLILTGNTINFIGIGFQGIAISWALLQLTGSPLTIGIMLFIRALPAILLVTLAGSLVDKVNRKLISLLSIFVQGVTMLIFAMMVLFWPVDFNLMILYLISLLTAVANTFYYPSSKSLIQEFTSKKNLLKANAKIESLSQVGMIIGTAIGGIVVTIFDPKGYIFINGVIYLLSALCFAALRYQTRENKNKIEKNPKLKTGGGFSYIKQERALFVCVLFLAVPSLVVQTNNVLIGAFTYIELGLNARHYSYINLSYGIGASLGGFILLKLNKDKIPDVRIIFIGLVCIGLFEIVFGFNKQILIAVISMFIVGFAISLSRSLLMSLVMKKTESNIAGRVHSIVNLFNSIIMLFAGLTLGLLAELTQFSVVFSLIGITVILIAILGTRYLKQ
ncbi:MFS transporter [Shouchella patagoniensis]|uniref:MFS transporter n=1 Tax=Shouchella patagoniensis TaxID=228576 RepID=UPI0009954CF8|nr:MFS transporter [Shouchella patagoniensis]